MTELSATYLIVVNIKSNFR